MVDILQRQTTCFQCQHYNGGLCKWHQIDVSQYIAREEPVCEYWGGEVKPPDKKDTPSNCGGCGRKA